MITLLLVNVFPARRARDVLMLMGLVFAMSLVMLMRFLQPERLMQVESMPEVTDFFATLQSPITPLLPSFWAGETLFASLQGGADPLHAAALWTSALALVVAAAARSSGGTSPASARRRRRARCASATGGCSMRMVRLLPLSLVRRQLLVKDLKVFLRDVSQWSQLLLLLALVLVYLYNFRVLDLERIPYMSGVLKNVYAFLNLGMAGFVMATVAVRFVFPTVSAEGAAFWIIRTAPISLRDFLWSKFWTGLVPVLLLSECLTIAGNELLGVDPFLKRVAAVTIVFMAFALVGLATGLGRALSTVCRRQPQPGGRLLRRRRLHDSGGAVRHRHDRAGRLALVGLPVSAVPAHAAVVAAAGPDDRQLRHGRAGERRHLLVWHALGSPGARGHGSDTIMKRLLFALCLLSPCPPCPRWRRSRWTRGSPRSRSSRSTPPAASWAWACSRARSARVRRCRGSSSASAPWPRRRRPIGCTDRRP